MKKKIGFLSVVIFLLLVGNAFAAYSFNWLDLTSDNRASGWDLRTGFALIDDTYNTTAEYSWGSGYNPISFTTWGYPGGPGPYIEYYWDVNVLSTASWSTPDDAEGKTFTWRAFDGGSTTLQFQGTVPDSVSDPIKQIALSTDLTVIAGGSHPTVSWSNSDYALLNLYRIRVLDEFNELLYQTSLSGPFGSADMVYTFGGFFFDSGVDYNIRIEARNHQSFLDPSGDIPLYASITNRSVVYEPYSTPVPLPSAIWLLGSGLIGLAGFRRKRKK